MTPHRHKFIKYISCYGERRVFTAGGEVLPVLGIGTVQIDKLGVITKVLHIPDLRAQLLSPQRFVKDLNLIFSIAPDGCFIYDKGRNLKTSPFKEMDGLIYAVEAADGPPATGCLAQGRQGVLEKIMLLHFRLGHPSFGLLKLMFPAIFKRVAPSSLHCDTCQLSKHKRVPFNGKAERCKVPFLRVHCDIWGPSSTTSLTGAKWYLIIVDDCTRLTWVYLLKSKGEASNAIENYFNMIRRQFDILIKHFRSDNAREFFNHHLSTFFEKQGVVHESSCVNTPQQNGVAERKIGHVTTMARTLLLHNNVPKYFWGEAILMAVHVINRLPSKTLGEKSPVNLMKEAYPNYSWHTCLAPRVFGCTAFVHLYNPEDKFSPRSLKCVFVGYSLTQKGYKCYHPQSKKFLISADVTFQETNKFFEVSDLAAKEKGGDKVESFFPPILIPESDAQPADAGDQRGADTGAETQPHIISEAAEEDPEEIESDIPRRQEVHENAHEEEEQELEGRSPDSDLELGWPIAL